MLKCGAKSLRYQDDPRLPRRRHRRHQSAATAALEVTFLDPAVDTPLSKGSGNTSGALAFSAICRTFLSGETRIRTGDTMIFSHIPNPLGMRKTRVGERNYVQGVPLDTTLYCPYC